mgnify:CR=1 FL=1
MPNWCMNTVTISGPKATLEEILTAAKEGRFLEYLAPIGEYNYDKAIDTWGTKWEPRFENIDAKIETEEGENFLQLSFDSAWSPPTDAYAAAEMSMGLIISGSYYEDGVGYVGLYDNGPEKTYTVDFTQDNWEESIPSHLISEWDLLYDYEQWKEYQGEN